MYVLRNNYVMSLRSEWLVFTRNREGVHPKGNQKHDRLRGHLGSMKVIQGHYHYVLVTKWPENISDS